MDILHTACFTGHRPQHLEVREGSNAFTALINDLEYEILELIHFKGINTFISGMAQGVDMYAARLILEMKKRGEQIRLICAIPCKSQSQKWGAEQRREYVSILREADKIVCLQDFYTPDCMQRRNEFMVDNSSYVIAVWNGSPGGTFNTIRYAKSQQKQIIRIDPCDYI